MRTGTLILMSFLCCFIAIVTVMTIGSYTVQRDELERAVAFATEEAVRQCVENEVTNETEVSNIVQDKLVDKVKSKNGQLTLYILHAEKDLIDVAVRFEYAQYNKSKKVITKRVTVIRDWEEGKENEAEIRFISAKYFAKAESSGGLKNDSVWRKTAILNNVLNNKQNEDGTWTTFLQMTSIK